MRPVARPGLCYGRVHRWRRYDAVSVRSLCEGVTALRSAVEFKFDSAAPHCGICYGEGGVDGRA